MPAPKHLAAAASLALVAVACQRTALDTTPPTATTPDGPSHRFYAALAPYGTWLDDATYGWVWMPSPAVVGTEFFPYLSGGDWRYTDSGWLFESVYPWGWAPFHYGRWAFDSGVGWMWVPGETWGPAWVDWRWNAGYVGWAPLPPLVGRASLEDTRSHWVVVSAADLTRPRLEAYVQPAVRAQLVFAAEATHPEAHPGWRAGPPGEIITAATGQPLPAVRLPHPEPNGLVRSHVEGDTVRHERYVEPTRPPAASTFPRNPPEFPLHVLRPHTIHAPVSATPEPARGPGGAHRHRGERLL